MGSCCCKQKNNAAIEAILVPDDLEQKKLMETDIEAEQEAEQEAEIAFVSLRRFSKTRQEWICQDKNCLISHDIHFTTEYFKTVKAEDTEDLYCSVCNKQHKIKWNYYTDPNGIVKH